MTVEAFRITKTTYLPTAFDGEGARRYGGRWNSPGTRMVYVASSVSLATLELLVHTEDISIIDGLYSIVPVRFQRSLVDKILVDHLPKGWADPELTSGTQTLGDQWIQSMTSLALQVPSAVNTRESNFLLNPAHPDFQEVRQMEAFPLRMDPRLK